MGCTQFMRLVQPLLPQLSDIAAKVSATLVADWIRLDVFIGHPTLGLVVNEVTYPSHIPDTCALGQWLRRYQQLKLTRVNGDSVQRLVGKAIGLDNATFHNLDGAHLSGLGQ